MKQLIAGLSLLLIAACRPATAARLTQTCVIANETCFVLRAGSGPLSPVQRMGMVNDRLAYILGRETCQPRSIRSVPGGREAAIYVGRSLLVTVTPADARATGMTSAAALARVWVTRLQAALPAGCCR